MPHSKVALRQTEYETWLEIDGVGRVPVSEVTDDYFEGPIGIVSKASLTSLRLALIRYAGTESPPPRSVTVEDPETGRPRIIWFPQTSSPERCAVELVDAPSAKFFERHSYGFVPEPVALALIDGGVLTVRVTFVIEGEEEPDRIRLTAILAPHLARTRSTVAHVDVDPEGVVDYSGATTINHPDFWVIRVYLAVPTRGRDVQSAVAIGQDALALLEAAQNGILTRATAASLVEAGHADLLVGQSEGPWLECKEQPYRPDHHGQYELAKDVSAFANSGNGGLILIGFRTRQIRGRDTITSVAVVPVDDRRVDRYRKWIARRVHPQLVDLAIREVDHGPGRITVISVPPQPRALQPFLVRGVLRDGKISGSHVAVFDRGDDAVVATGVEELHALIVAGRAALGYSSSPPGA